LSETEKDRQKKVLELLDASGRRLHGLLYRLTLSEDMAGDLMQELFIRLSQSRGFDKAQNPFTYARRAAINLAFEKRKKSKVKLHGLDEDCLPEEQGASALRCMVQKEEMAQVLEVLPRLNRLAREVIVMHYIEQASYEEIGRRLGKKPQHIRSVSAKALARLRKLLSGTNHQPDSQE